MPFLSNCHTAYGFHNEKRGCKPESNLFITLGHFCDADLPGRRPRACSYRLRQGKERGLSLAFNGFNEDFAIETYHLLAAGHMPKLGLIG